MRQWLLMCLDSRHLQQQFHFYDPFQYRSWEQYVAKGPTRAWWRGLPGRAADVFALVRGRA